MAIEKLPDVHLMMNQIQIPQLTQGNMGTSMLHEQILIF